MSVGWFTFVRNEVNEIDEHPEPVYAPSTWL